MREKLFFFSADTASQTVNHASHLVSIPVNHAFQSRHFRAGGRPGPPPHIGGIFAPVGGGPSPPGCRAGCRLRHTRRFGPDGGPFLHLLTKRTGCFTSQIIIIIASEHGLFFDGTCNLQSQNILYSLTTQAYEFEKCILI